MITGSAERELGVPLRGKETHMFSIGLDVHQNSTALCQLDSTGRRVSERVIRGSLHAVRDELKKLRRPFKVAFEASCGYGTLHDLLGGLDMVKEVHVAHPAQLKLIFRSKNKNDRNDARKIATLLYMDQLPRVHVPPIDVRAWRGLIEHRRRLVDKRTRAKCALRAQVRALGIVAPRRQSLWSRKGLEWLEQQDLPTELDRLKRESLLTELRMLDQEIKKIERKLNEIGAADRRVLLLRTMPGVGPRTAEAVAAYIDDPQRFTSIKSIGKYFGIVPMQDASAGKNRLGHITREGPPTVRKLIVQSAWQAIRGSARLHAFFEKVRGGQKQRTGVALIATAHKMLRVMLSMLRNNEAWRKDEKPARKMKPKKSEATMNATRSETPGTGGVLPAAATANGTETQRPRRRGRGKDSAVISA
jgi:transposase